MRRHIVLPVGMLQTNCYLVYREGGTRCAVIDPGGSDARILQTLEEHSLTPDYIFLTHGHFDHILAVPFLREQTGAKVVIHEADGEWLTDMSRSKPVAKKKTFGKPADILVKDGDVISLDGLEFRWLHTPGHTVGSCSILCEDALYSGDTLFYEECGRCDFPGGDFNQMLESLARLARLPGNPSVFPGHERFSDLEHERTHNGYMLQALGV